MVEAPPAYRDKHWRVWHLRSVDSLWHAWDPRGNGMGRRNAISRRVDAQGLLQYHSFPILKRRDARRDNIL